MITFLLTSLLGVMLLGIPILISIALIGFVSMAMLPDVVMPLFAQKMFGQLDSFTPRLNLSRYPTRGRTRRCASTAPTSSPHPKPWRGGLSRWGLRYTG